MKDMEALTNFLLDTASLTKLESNFNNKPNIFSILKVADREIRHSNLLAWLLNPKENHNLGSLFLEKYLYMFVRECAVTKDCINLLLISYDDFQVKREWKNIDLLLVSEKYHIVFAIENKVYTKEHDNQLERYYEIVQESFRDYETYFIFLTLDGSESQSMRNIWQAMSYQSIIEVLDDIVTTQSLSDEVKFIIENYIETVRSLINMESPEIKELCIQIYEKHKRAIDLIMENVPTNESTFLNDLNSWIVQDWSKKYHFKNLNNHKWFEFSSSLMDELLPNINGNIAYKYFISVVTNTNPWYCKISFELQYNGLVDTPTYELVKVIDQKINHRNLEERGRNNSGRWNVYGFKNWQINIDEENYEEDCENIKANFEKILFEEIPKLEKKIEEIKESLD